MVAPDSRGPLSLRIGLRWTIRSGAVFGGSVGPRDHLEILGPPRPDSSRRVMPKDMLDAFVRIRRGTVLTSVSLEGFQTCTFNDVANAKKVVNIYIEFKGV